MENAKGCILYMVNKEAGNPDSIYIIEVWQSKEDHDNSLKLPGVGELIKQAIPILDGNPKAARRSKFSAAKALISICQDTPNKSLDAPRKQLSF